VRQEKDFSCGAASVATILKFAYDRDVSREQVLHGMLRMSDPASVRVRGFSMLDMKRYVEALGFRGVGYRVTLEKLLQVRVPVIILLNMNGYEHFVVLRKTAPGHVFVADPALGNRMLAP